MVQKTKAELLLTKFIKQDGDLKNRSIKDRHLGVDNIDVTTVTATNATVASGNFTDIKLSSADASGNVWTSSDTEGHGFWEAIPARIASMFSTFGGDGSDGAQTVSSATDFSEGLAPVKIAAKYVFFEKNGTRTLIGADKSIGKWGYVNKSGELIITPQFDWAMNFTGDVAAVITDFKTGYIDKTGKYIWKPSN